MAIKNKYAPPEFWKFGRFHLVHFTFLCEYPYETPGVYAVYLNHETKLPERIPLAALNNQMVNVSEMRSALITELLMLAGQEQNIFLETIEANLHGLLGKIKADVLCQVLNRKSNVAGSIAFFKVSTADQHSILVCAKNDPFLDYGIPIPRAEQWHFMDDIIKKYSPGCRIVWNEWMEQSRPSFRVTDSDGNNLLV